MNPLIIGIGELRAVHMPGPEATATLVTYALGSCIGVVVHDAEARVGGMLHYMLPDSSLDPQKAACQPGLFADTGIPLLFRTCYELGADKKRLRVFAAGGAQPTEGAASFEIGKRNQLALRKILWRSGVFLRGESLGGVLSRTVRLEVSTGRIGLRMGAKEESSIDLSAGRSQLQIAGSERDRRFERRTQ